MVTGFEADNQRAMFSIAMSLKKIAEELETLNKNFAKSSGNEAERNANVAAITAAQERMHAI